MRSPAADRALRRLVAQLAAAPADDVALVLESLEPDQRDAVRVLLDAYGEPRFEAEPARILAPVSAPPEPEPDTAHLEGLSPELAARVVAAEAGAAGAGVRMTPAAKAALAAAARALPVDPALSLDAPGSVRRRRGAPWRWLRGASWA